jgi:hypothetical protein
MIEDNIQPMEQHIEPNRQDDKNGIEAELDNDTRPDDQDDENNLRIGKITQLQYYAYRLSVPGEFNPILNAGKLTEQFIVDIYVKIEANLLNYIQMNQNALRADSYAGLLDHITEYVQNRDLKAGTIVILSSLFTSSSSAMAQNFQDTTTIVRKYGKPDLFITMTCNLDGEKSQKIWNLGKGRNLVQIWLPGYSNSNSKSC